MECNNSRLEELGKEETRCGADSDSQEKHKEQLKSSEINQIKRRSNHCKLQNNNSDKTHTKGCQADHDYIFTSRNNLR